MRTIAGIQGGVLEPPAPNADIKMPDSSDTKAVAKEFETIFLNEFLKKVMEQTALGKDKILSAYVPLITLDVSKALAERGIGVGEFLSKSVIKHTDAAGQKKSDVAPVTKDVGSKQLPWDGKLKLPVNGRITSGYGLRHDPLRGGIHKHNGVDIAVPEGTPIKAVAPGKVISSSFSVSYGNYVVIDHENGLTSLYAHSSRNIVKAGDVVDKNDIIALSGSTGRSTGPHVHFEMRKEGSAVDPNAGGEIG